MPQSASCIRSSRLKNWKSCSISAAFLKHWIAFLKRRDYDVKAPRLQSCAVPRRILRGNPSQTARRPNRRLAATLRRHCNLHRLDHSRNRTTHLASGQRVVDVLERTSAGARAAGGDAACEAIEKDASSVRFVERRGRRGRERVIDPVQFDEEHHKERTRRARSLDRRSQSQNPSVTFVFLGVLRVNSGL